uniref:Endothelin-like toxin domain-containing protein n=1 Tax=Oryzias latipes TaxID=8090 RepID=A0A3B3HCG4_ORYLA
VAAVPVLVGRAGVPLCGLIAMEWALGCSALAPSHHVRTRRCACNIEDDYECHYFCHLDVIWVNTPSKTTIYGLGGALLRRRRSTGRCTCADMGDKACSTFCSFRFGHVMFLVTSSKGRKKSNMAAPDTVPVTVGQRWDTPLTVRQPLIESMELERSNALRS